ncbi:DNA repair protein RecN [Ginsengibacter hankyongi]|uniref:DNA repair protein RecN n=1 Tax=Ginsengibacter hankyongi TaxID=2607284 RepID=A0A5J5IGH3_9BACT|nr:DNA repair protein RecN [Ginsengibacter hankyongi]KAA9039201.1 DNA repair protein RecN [Ginsengibacter hankyongi]
MLQQLHIQNYAIIDSIEINFSSHLNIITGETGAGKSILMGALNLILGERADTLVLADKEKKCFIEGIFKTNHAPVKEFLLNNELDCDEELVIRRELAVNGKSRAFINDTPVTLNELKQLSSLLVDLHQQFDTQDLGNNDFQREVIDALAGNTKDIEQYQSVYKNYRNVLKELETLKNEQAAANKEFDYNKFLFDELEEANFSENEIEDIDAEIKLISNAENIKEILSSIYFELEESEQPIVQNIKAISHKLQGLESYHHNIEPLTKRLQSVQIEMQDIASEVSSINESVIYDVEKISLLNERMAAGYKLLKKHGVTTTAQLLDIKNELEAQLDKVTNLKDDILQREKQSAELYNEALKIAEKISLKRQKQLKPFEEKVNQLLKQVGMPNAKLKVDIQNANNLNLFGINNIEFLFNANMPSGIENNNQRFEPLRKVASGGELSRLMLSIKSLVAKSVQLPVLIFDEIDSGISGEAARQVGIIMKELSDAHQVISITHQPQIAAKAETHFFVYKEIVKDKIITSIRQLNGDERITTIAKMLSGEKPTAAAFENAREMIGN